MLAIAVQTVVTGKLLLVNLSKMAQIFRRRVHLKITFLPLILLCKIKLCVTYELSIKEEDLNLPFQVSWSLKLHYSQLRFVEGLCL